MTVLLNVDWMCAIPDWMFFLTFFFLATIRLYLRAAPAMGEAGTSYFLAIFLPAIVLAGPLRVRAFV